ncbi:hypothetical protein ANAPC5_01468 [Anaplasma phagocytophilum]|nr:hypothetical protein ANAPC5_01468 [Anaplasma phagocytophilum]
MEATSSMEESYSSLLPRDRAFAHIHAQRVGSDVEREDADWSGGRMAPTAVST